MYLSRTYPSGPCIPYATDQRKVQTCDQYKRSESLGEELTFKDGEDAAQSEIQERRFDLGLWNEFLEHPDDFEALFSDVLIGKPKSFIAIASVSLEDV